MGKYLDNTGLQYFWGKIKEYVASAVKVTGVKGNSESSYRTGNVNITPANVGAVAKSGDTMTGDLQLGSSAQNTLPTKGLRVHDVRNVDITNNTLDKAVNFFFSNKNMPTSAWWALMHVRGWTGGYASWELAGASHNADQKTLPLYVRTGSTDNTFGAWRKIYDSSNKPTLAELGAASTAAATQSANGLMSAADKKKLDGMGTITTTKIDEICS